MSDPVVTNPLTPLVAPTLQPYQSYLPTAFSDDLSLLQKVNYLINYLTTVTTTVNNAVNTVNGFATTIDTDVINQLTTWNTDGTLASIINETVFGDINNRLDADDKAIGVNIESFPLQTGETTDTARIQRALNSLTSGGVLVLNSATYVIGDADITIPSDNISIIGKGKSTLIQLKNGANLPNGGFYASQRKGFGLFNVAFDGNNANQTVTNHTVRLDNCDQPTVENIFFSNVYGNGITFSGSTNFHINRIYGNNFTGASGDPGELLYGQGVQQGTISNVIGTNISDHLIYIDSRNDGTPSYDVLMSNMLGVNCGSAALTTGAAFNIVSDCRRFNLVNCVSINSRCGFYFHENGSSGLVPSDYSLTNCRAYGSSYAAGFYMTGLPSAETLTNAKLSGCVANANVGTTSSFGFRFENLDGLTLDNCDAIGNGANGFIFRSVTNANINGGVARNNGVTSSMQGVKVGGDNTQTCQNITIRGLDTGDTQTTKTQTYGVTVNSGCANIKVIGGNHIGNITGDILISDPTTGEYIADTNGFKAGIVLSVAANGGDGTLTVAKGSEFVSSVASSTNGFMINLQNLPAGAVPIVIPFKQDATGFGTSGSQMNFIYTRSASSSAIEMGIKTDPSGANTPLSTCTVGTLSLAIFY